MPSNRPSKGLRYDPDLKYAADLDAGEIWLFGPIGEAVGGPEADRVKADLRGIQTDRVKVFINSPGGYVAESVAIHNTLKRDPRPVDVTVDGIAASGASLVAMAGDTVTMAAGAFLMIHSSRGLAVGNASLMAKSAETLRKFDGKMADIYARRTGQSREQIEAWMDAETWFSGEEAVEAGFATAVEEDREAAAVAHFDLSLFRNVPAALREKAEHDAAEEIARRAVAFLGVDRTPLSGNHHQKGRDMPKNAHNPEDRGPEAQGVKAERERVTAIKNICGGQYPDIEAKAIEEGWSDGQAAEACLERLRNSRPSVSSVALPQDGDLRQRKSTWAAAMLMHAGLDTVAEAAFDEHTCQAADDLKLTNLVDVCATALRMDGQEVPRDRLEMVKASFSTVSLPNILGGSMDKVVLAAYEEAPATWEALARVLPVSNFRPQDILRPSWVGQTEKVGATGELKHGTISESLLSSLKIDTFGKILKISRQMIINDDTSTIADTAAAFGRMARRGVNDLVWGVVLANAGDFFHADNGNLLTGGASDLSLTSLATAVAAMRTQRDGQGNDLDVTPKVLAVPPELEIEAREILESVEKQAAENAPMGNALKGIAELAVESRLSNTTKWPTTASATAWYLFAGPADAALVVAFLNGKRTPTVEFRGLTQTEADTLGVCWRVYMDYGASLNDPRAAVKSDGV